MRASSAFVLGQTIAAASALPGAVALASSGPRAACVLAGAEEDEVALAGGTVTIPGAEQFDLRSNSGLTYRIFVAGPTGEVPDHGSPVIYLTDGNANFPVLLAAARQRSRDDPRAVVVGIGYPGDDGAIHRERRTFDLTPVSSGSPPPDGFPVYKSGGNDQFFRFIEDEVKPAIERRHKVDRRRQTLFGHSLGGLFVLHVLFTAPDSFQTYLASSPSLWWDGGSIVAEEHAFSEAYAGRRLEARLLITFGQWEQGAGPGVSPEQSDTLSRRRMAGNAKELATRLANAQIGGMAVKLLEFAEEEHGSVVLPAASRGVRFAIDEK